MTWSWDALWDALRAAAENDPNAVIKDYGWAEQLTGILSTVLWISLALVGAAGGIYALYVGIKMARADSAEAREENKKRLVNIIITVVVVIALIIFFNTFLPMILGATGAFGDLDFSANQ